LVSAAVLLLVWVLARLLVLVAAVLQLFPPVRIVAVVVRLLPLQLLLLAVASNSIRNNPVILPP
jgi:hypothetical protein